MTSSELLEHRLRQIGAELDLPPRPPVQVMARGRVHKRRRRTLRTVGAVAAIIAVAGGVALPGRPDGRSVSVADPAVLGDIGMQWHAVAGPAGPMELGGFSGAGDGPLYALRNESGDLSMATAANSVLWRSEDGVSWSPVSTFGDDFRPAGLGASGRRVYAIGTGAAEQVPGTPRSMSPLAAGWSDDGGVTWDHAELPMDLRGIAEHAEVRLGVESVQVVVGGAGVIMMTTITAAPDVAGLVPAGVTVADGWARSPDDSGVDLLGPLPAGCTDATVPFVPGAFPGSGTAPGERAAVACHPGADLAATAAPDAPDDGQYAPQEAQGVVRHLSWAELGIDGDFLRAVLGRSVAFVASAGSTTFERVDLDQADPDPTAHTGRRTIAAVVSDGFVVSTEVTGTGQSSAHLYRSGDGRDWRPMSLPPGLRYVSEVGTFEGRLALHGKDTDFSEVVASLDPAGDWSLAVLPTLIPDGSPMTRTDANGERTSFPSEVVISAHGIAVTATTFGGGLGHWILVTRDGRTWQAWAASDVAGGQVVNAGTAGYVGDQLVVGVEVVNGGSTTPPGADRFDRVTLVGVPG